MSKVDQFEDLKAWQLARKLTSKIYRLAKEGEFARDFGFRDQICRAAVSISSNIAEGFERKSDKAFLQFLAIAKGSAGEVRSQLYIALDLCYITQEHFNELNQDISETSRMLSGLIDYLNKETDQK